MISSTLPVLSVHDPSQQGEFDAMERFVAEGPQPIYLEADGSARVPTPHERLTNEVFHRFSELIVRYASRDGRRVVEEVNLCADSITDITSVSRSFAVPPTGRISVLGARYEHVVVI